MVKISAAKKLLLNGAKEAAGKIQIHFKKRSSINPSKKKTKVMTSDNIISQLLSLDITLSLFLCL